MLAVIPQRDEAERLCGRLERKGYSLRIFDTLASAAAAFDDEAGMILLAEDALTGDHGTDGLGPLLDLLKAQPPWSDIPLVVLLRDAREDPPDLPEIMRNVMMLERPCGLISLDSAVAWALRSRRKQFRTRDRLIELAESREALRASEAELRLVADSLPVLIAFVDSSYHYRFANRAYETWFYRSPDQIIGRHVAEIVGEDGFNRRKSAMDRALAGEEVRLDLPWPHRDGRRREADIHYIPRWNRAGQVDGFYVFVMDVTDRLRAMEALEQAAETLEQRVAERTAELHAEMASRARAETALRQSQKMEAVGQLTGGIAHDFNNMLTGVIGSLDIMKRRIAAGRFDDLGRFMEAASASAQRAAALTARLLAFSRRQSLDSRPLDINALVAGLEDLLRRSIRETIHLRLVLDPGLPPGLADANQLESAILNLVINARDAMPDGGALVVRTGSTSIDPALVESFPGLFPGAYVTLSVTDTGVGMTAETLERVFEPFFTTKPVGQGTGLGLSMVYGFARQSGGQVYIDSRPGAGTTVTVYLPATGAGEAVAETPKAGPVADGGGETVLLVEDDAAVRLLVRDVLEELGYRVLEAPDAFEAVAILEQGGGIDLMVSDVGLPGMNGRQLAEVARRKRPALPILFITGYAENAAERAGFLGPGMDMLTKPFALEELSGKVAEMLAR